MPEMPATIMEIIRDLLIFVAVMFALCIVLIVVISKMPDDNPLKQILTALSYRLAATLAAGAVAVPVEPIPGLDVLYDIAVPIALIWYWFTFFRDLCAPRAEELQPGERRQTKQGSAQTVDSPTSDVIEPQLPLRTVSEAHCFRRPSGNFMSPTSFLLNLLWIVFGGL